MAISAMGRYACGRWARALEKLAVPRRCAMCIALTRTALVAGLVLLVTDTLDHYFRTILTAFLLYWYSKNWLIYPIFLFSVNTANEHC